MAISMNYEILFLQIVKKLSTEMLSPKVYIQKDLKYQLHI